MATIQKNKKTVKLFWKEIKEDPTLLARIKKQNTIWDELNQVEVDTAKLEELFENKAKDLMKQVIAVTETSSYAKHNRESKRAECHESF